jgi:serine/threonine protein kinase
MSADRNLLYGMLAYQNGFVTRQQLLDAFAAWMGRKDIPIGELLRERASLTEEDRRFLDSFVERQIGQHGDAGKGLASLPVDPLAVGELERLPDAEVQAALATVSDHQRCPTPADGLGAGPPGRYRALRRHAEGGLGVVYVAEDEELRREVALKRIKERFADDPDSRRRFVLEAKVTGKLGHPGIVPVHGLVAEGGGRPAYAMRFIKGETLEAAIQRFHAGGGPPLRDLLTRFVAVCNAVAYAHSEGVIHRDLKPANVMLGGYGETLVLDWGLAKVIASGGEEAEAAGRTQEACLGHSVHGRAMGTPAFMPPEQARGDHDSVGVESDVFALGAMLYCILTGQPPYTGPGAAERALAGAVTPARRLKRDVPAALEAVCQKAMAPWRSERYPSASALAADVEHWLGDEPVSVYREPLAARAGRWARKHRTLVMSAVAALIIGVVSLGVGLAVVSGLNRKLEAALLEAKKQRSIALAVKTFLQGDLLGQLDIRNQSEGSNLDRYGPVIRGPAGMVDIRNQSNGSNPNLTVKELLDRASRVITGRFADQPETEAELRQTIGTVYYSLGDFERGRAHLERAVALFERHLGPDAAASLTGKTHLALLYHSEGRLERAGRLFREIVEKRERQMGADDVHTAIAKNNLAALCVDQGEEDQAEALYTEVLRVAASKLPTDHPLTLAVKSNLALLHSRQGRYDLALPLLQEAVKLQEKKWGAADYSTLSGKNNLASLYRVKGDYEQAGQLWREVLREREKRLPPDHPDILISKHNLASSYLDQKKYAMAEELLVEVARAREKKLGAGHPDTLRSKGNLAVAYWGQGHHARAEALLVEVSQRYEKTLGANNRDTLRSKYNLASVQQDKKEYTKALPLLLEVARKSEEVDGPNDRATLTYLSGLASLHQRQGQYDKAEPLGQEVFSRAVKALGFHDPDSQYYLNELLGLYDQWGKPERAEPLLRQRLEFHTASHGADSPVTVATKAALALSLLRQRRYTDAEPLLRASLRIREQAQPEEWTTFNTKSMLGGALLGQKKYAEAESLLVQGYEGMKKREAKIPNEIRAARLREALERLITLYDATGEKAKAASYRKELETLATADDPPAVTKRL